MALATEQAWHLLELGRFSRVLKYALLAYHGRAEQT
jgi:hypothetical protein